MRSVLVVVVAAATLVGGCAAGTSTEPATPPVVSAVPPDTAVSSQPATVVAGWTATGGLCPTTTCSSAFTVSSDGSWILTSAEDSQAGSLPAATVAALVDAAARTRIPEAPPFTGTCPTAYDGSEVVYSWTDTAGQLQTVSACDVAIPDDDPLVVALTNAESLARSAPPADDFTVTAQRAQAIADTVIGMTEADAVATIEGVSSLPLTTRVVARDGVSFPVTEDYSPTRVNLTIDAGLVTAVSIG